PPAWRLKIASVLKKLPTSCQDLPMIRGAVNPRADSRCELAYSGFELLGPHAAQAVPDLGRLLRRTRSWHSSRQITWALAHIGPEGLPHLVAGLENPCCDRKLAFDLIGGGHFFGTNPVPALPLLARS